MITWEQCNLRKWLNNDFYYTAFTTNQKKIIVERLNTGNGAYLHHDYVPKKMHRMNVNVLTSDSYETYEERGCRDTKDNVFLLSIEEALKYFGKSYTKAAIMYRWRNLTIAKGIGFEASAQMMYPCIARTCHSIWVSYHISLKLAP